MFHVTNVIKVFCSRSGQLRRQPMEVTNLATKFCIAKATKIVYKESN